MISEQRLRYNFSLAPSTKSFTVFFLLTMLNKEIKTTTIHTKRFLFVIQYIPSQLHLIVSGRISAGGSGVLNNKDSGPKG